MVIPWTSLSEDALRGVIEEFITREGTEYGLVEQELSVKGRSDTASTSGRFSQGSLRCRNQFCFACCFRGLVAKRVAF